MPWFSIKHIFSDCSVFHSSHFSLKYQTNIHRWLNVSYMFMYDSWCCTNNVSYPFMYDYSRCCTNNVSYLFMWFQTLHEQSNHIHISLFSVFDQNYHEQPHYTNYNLTEKIRRDENLIQKLFIKFYLREFMFIASFCGLITRTSPVVFNLQEVGGLVSWW